MRFEVLKKGTFNVSQINNVAPIRECPHSRSGLGSGRHLPLEYRAARARLGAEAPTPKTKDRPENVNLALTVGLHDIPPGPYAAVEHDRHLVANRIGDVLHHFDGGGGAVELSTAMI